MAPIRKQLGWRTIFNLLGPLSSPVDSSYAHSIADAIETPSLLEARLIGVARRDLGPAFIEAFRLSGARKAMVVCGAEDLDELSCAGPTYCWRIRADGDNEDSVLNSSGCIESFVLAPEDFGLPSHPLTAVQPGNEPSQNAAIFLRILRGELDDDDALVHFVLINTAALLVVSGVCDADTSCMGDGDDGRVIIDVGPGGGRWKEGVRRARWAIRSGRALKEWEAFVQATHSV